MSAVLNPRVLKQTSNLSIQVESFKDTLEELKPILIPHYKELALDQDKVPLDPNYEIYFKREELGELLFVTCRLDGELVGYFIGFIAPGLHYRTCLTCTMDIFYVKKECRGHSIGARLFGYVERELKSRGVDRWYVGSKAHQDASWLFEKLGFTRVEIYYSKYLE